MKLVTLPSAVIVNADCVDAMAVMAENSVDAIVTDPPYGLRFMGKGWDDQGAGPQQRAWHARWVTQALRVLKPGGHMLAFGGSRTVQHLAVAAEDCGFEIRDMLMWVYGCLSEDTEILVDGSWVHYSKAIQGRRALCYDVASDGFAWQPIEDLYVYDYDDIAYRVESTGTDQIVSRNHRCLVRRGGRWEFVVAEEAAREQEVCVPILEDVCGLLDALRVFEQVSGAKEQMVQGLPGAAPACTQGTKAVGSTRTDGDCMCCMRHARMENERTHAEDQGADVFVTVQREATSCRIGEAFTQGTRGVDGGVISVAQSQNVGREQSSVEGRSDVQAEQGQLCRPEVRAVPCGVCCDGAEGRLRHGASLGGGNDAGALLDAHGGGASHGPRHAEQCGDESGVVRDESGSQEVRGARFAVANLARITPFHLRGVVWCVRVPTGAFVARRNGKVFVTGNSGFPKSLDVGKALDRIDKIGSMEARARTFTAWMRSTGITAAQINAATDSFMGSHYLTDKSQPAVATEDLFSKLRPLLPVVPAEIEELVRSRTVEIENMKRRMVLGQETKARSTSGKSALPTVGGTTVYETWDITAPATDLARQWNGWGTALKPAIEPIVLARKPFPGSVAANVQTWGVGAINIDGCKVAMGVHEDIEKLQKRSGGKCGFSATAYVGGAPGNAPPGWAANGRWPANFLHDGSPEVTAPFPKDAASFFYSAKAQTGEREYGTSSLPERTLARSGGAQLAEARGEDYEEGQGIGLNRVQIRRNIHPTVKPVELLAYLQRLVTPPGGLVLDPFAGSGSAGIAAAFEGFQYVGMELDTQEGYFGIAAARIAQAQEDAAAGLTWEQALKKDKAARGPRVDAPEDAG